MKPAPYKDYAGQQLFEGDTLAHPSGEVGRVVFIGTYSRPEDSWRVDYGDSTSRLCLQVGAKGQAVKAQ